MNSIMARCRYIYEITTVPVRVGLLVPRDPEALPVIDGTTITQVDQVRRQCTISKY